MIVRRGCQEIQRRREWIQGVRYQSSPSMLDWFLRWRKTQEGGESLPPEEGDSSPPRIQGSSGEPILDSPGRGEAAAQSFPRRRNASTTARKSTPAPPPSTTSGGTLSAAAAAPPSKAEEAWVTAGPSSFQGMALVFLGTASGSPSPWRNTQAIALKLHSRTFLFDCGEGTQHRILHSPYLHPGMVDRVFITHLHGDHVLGLPGIVHAVCSGSQHRGPLEIYGPPGLRRMLRVVIDTVESRLTRPYLVHELGYPPLDSLDPEKAATQFPNWRSGRERRLAEASNRSPPRRKGEHTLFPDADGVWHVFEDDRYEVTAVNLRHTVPCWGYAVREKDHRGSLDVAKLRQLGMPPGPHYRTLAQGGDVQLNSGEWVRSRDVMSAPVQGRKVVILGDTCDSENMARIGRNADVLVHECTLDEVRASEAVARGHSTPSMVGSFARRLGARHLIATHFSNKYDDGTASLAWGSIHAPQGQAGAKIGLQPSHALHALIREVELHYGRPVIPAQDYLWVSIPYHRNLPLSIASASRKL